MTKSDLIVDNMADILGFSDIESAILFKSRGRNENEIENHKKTLEQEFIKLL